MDDIGAYLDALDTSKGLHAAWKKYWDAKVVAVNPPDANGISCAPMYKLPSGITPGEAITHLDKSLYAGEWADMNPDEMEIFWYNTFRCRG